MYETPANYGRPSNAQRNRVIALVALVIVAIAAVVLALVLSGGNSASAKNAARSGGPAAPVSPSTDQVSSSTSSSAASSAASSSSAPVSSAAAPHGTGSAHSTAPPPTSTSATRTATPPPTHVSVSLAGPASYRGWCPIALTYTATITVDHTPADISYHWNDGTASAGAPTLHVTHSPVTVSRTINPSTSTSGSLSLDVLGPVPASSNSAHFVIACQGVSVSTRPTVSPAAYTGDCSRGITFTFTATVYATNGPFTVQYRWVRSDGPDATQTLSFGPGSSSQTVHTTWTLSGPAGRTTRWAYLQILGDHGTTSDPVSFDIWCV